MTRAWRLIAASSVLVAACGDLQRSDGASWSTLAPVALDSRVAFVDRTNARAFLLDPGDAALAVRAVALTPDPVLAARRNGADELVVLSRGERGGPGVPAAPPFLTIVPADATKAVRTVKLGSRFDAMAQSPDGRFVVASFAPGRAPGEVLFNPNEIAIVDLTAAAPVAVPRTIRSFGGVPTGIAFSPAPLRVGGRARSLAVLFSDGYVTLLDLDRAAQASEITIPLTPPEDRRTVRPVQVLFQDATKDADATVFVRTDGADDIYALALKPDAAPASADANDFHPVLSLLGAGTRPADMALFTTSDGASRLLVVSPGSSDAWVVDAQTSRSTRIPLDAAASRIALFTARGPGDTTERKRALLLAPGTPSRALGFLDLDQLEALRARNLDSRSMGAPAAQLLLLPVGGRAVVLHPAGAGGPGISVVDLERRTIAPIVAGVSLSGVVLGPPGTDRLWVPAAGGVDLPFIRLSSLETGFVTLDAPVAAVLPVGKHVVVVHPSVAGQVTVLDANAPDRSSAHARAGFLLDGLLQRGNR